ncbi:MAG TPA: RsbRD N-terminal domain-containing protein [Desulfatiglandales bacterium]|nr:RsbRD N-terminal domain-containing protein [Desulfatiglandales bacterium]
MNLKGLLSEKRTIILESWFDLIVQSYPPETSKFLKREKDRFDNPVAYEFRQGIEGIYEALLHGMDRNKVLSFLDRIISIRAIQDLIASGAVAFIFLLKTAIRKQVEGEIRKEGIYEDLLDLESRIDGLALMCFDIYAARREKLYKIKENEAKNRVNGLLKMAGLIYEQSEESSLKEEKPLTG